MAHRGRGTLEVKPSSNPFFQTVNSQYGGNPEDLVKWKHEINPSFLQKTETNDSESFTFLYKRTSDDIGARVKKESTMSLPQMPTKTEFLKKRREKLLETIPPDELSKFTRNNELSRLSSEETLKLYKHVPKEEDPRYTLSSNEYGKKVPTVATFVGERYTKPQAFSKSFNNFKPQSSSLNTYITRSNIHPTLDPQFV
mmetsp:Transcript_18016/g.16309  ORF Transcript_18016/g.16309 Transcript_18016/m.16309 type:complete len:198 (-) Transcript_18016:432-1025(-)